MKKISPNQFVFIVIALVSQFFCFFLKTAALGETDCYYTFSGKLICLINGQEQTKDFGDCKEDNFCLTIKSSPVYGGFSFAFGIVVLGIYIYVWKNDVDKYTTRNMKLAVLLILSVASIFEILIPLLYIVNQSSLANLKFFPLVLEFIAFLSYATNWILMMQKKVMKTVIQNPLG